MNLGENKFYLDLMQWVVTIALAVSVWLRKPGTDAGLAVAALRKEVDAVIDDHQQRLIRIEIQLSHMATSEALAKLDGTVQQLTERTAGLAEQLRGIRAALDVIQQFLLSKK